MMIDLSPELLYAFGAGLLFSGLMVGLIAWWMRKSYRHQCEQELCFQKQLHDAQLDNMRASLGDALAQREEDRQSLEELRRELLDKNRLFTDLKARYETETAANAERQLLLEETSTRLGREFTLLAQRIFDERNQQFREQSKETLSASVDPLRREIESFRKKVEDVYDKESSDRNQLVGQVVALQKQTEQIGSDAVALTRALKGNNKTQGTWGEVVLERLLQQSGLQPGREYLVQPSYTDGSGKRRQPDVVLTLPEGRHIIIDSKVSLVHFERFTNAVDSADKDKALAGHLQSLRQHVKQLSEKSYENLQGLHSLDFVFLFVPIEAALSVALEHDDELFQSAYQQHVVLVSPSSMMVTLRTVETLWRYDNQNQNAMEIAQQAGGLHDQFVLLLESLQDIERQIQKTAQACQSARGRLVDGRGNLVRRVDKLRTLGAKVRRKIPDDWNQGSSEEQGMT